MNWKQSILNSNSGFTLIELLVASAISLIILALALTGMLANRETFHYDLVRTRLNQNLRGALDVVGANTREAGESLPSTFAAVEVIDGGGAVSDELVLTRNLLDEVLKVCVDIVSGSGVQQIYFANASAISGCDRTSNTHNFNIWSAYRQDHDNAVQAYIFNSVTKQGEFFTYTGEGDNTIDYWIERSPGTWSHDYPVGAATVYMLEKWNFRVEDNAVGDDLLQIIQDEDLANPLNVLSAVINFQVQVEMNDGTVKTSFDPVAGDQWINIQNIEVTLSGEDTSFRGEAVESTLTARYFPRNILSN